MVKARKSGRTPLALKESYLMETKKVEGYSSGPTEASSQEFSKTTNSTGKEPISGLTDVSTAVTGSATRSVEKGCSSGMTVAATEAIISRTESKALVC